MVEVVEVIYDGKDESGLFTGYLLNGKIPIN